MIGQSIPLITRREFDFGGVKQSGTVEFIMVKQLIVTAAAQADLVVRVHSIDITAPMSTVKVLSQQYSQDMGDPGEDFVGTEQEISLGNTTTAGELKVLRILTPYGQMLRFLVRGDRGGMDTNDIKAEISVELIPRASD